MGTLVYTEKPLKVDPDKPCDPKCKHEKLRFIGDQDGLNGAVHPVYQCEQCGTSIVAPGLKKR